MGIVEHGNQSGERIWDSRNANISPPFGCGRYRAENGATVLELDFFADPDKDEDWLKTVTVGMSKREVDIEFRRNKEVFAGSPVYPQYLPLIHNPVDFRNEPFQIHQGAIYFAGWDTGETLNHAFVLAQYHKDNRQIQVLGEYTAYMDSLENMIKGLDIWLSRKDFSRARPIYHVADPAFSQRSGHTGLTAQQILYSKGYRVKPARTNSWRQRHDDASWALETMIDEETPKTVINGFHCPKLIKALAGQYRYEERKNSIGISETDMYKEVPIKDEASHIANAFEYMCGAIKEYEAKL